jgi:hypothetical protein
MAKNFSLLFNLKFSQSYAFFMIFSNQKSLKNLQENFRKQVGKSCTKFIAVVSQEH